MRKLQVAIVGYGIAGIAAAILLRRLGHSVAHFERAAQLRCGGAGLLLNTTGLAVLDRLGLRDAALSRGAIVSRVCGETLSGRKVMDLSYDEHLTGNHALGIQHAAVFDLLRTPATTLSRYKRPGTSTRSMRSAALWWTAIENRSARLI